MKSNYYNKIADDYHQKRKKPWGPLENYISELNSQSYEFNGVNLDIGCANGRHFKLFKKKSNILIGIDNSFEFLKIANKILNDSTIYSYKEKSNIHVLMANVVNLPIRPNIVQNIFSIATIHHLENQNNRIRAMNQIIQVLTKNGYFIFTVWRRWQKKYRKYFFFDKLKRVFISSYKKMQKSKGLEYYGDNFIPWTISKKQETHERFYHFFSKKEVKKLLCNFEIKDIRKIGGSTGKDNFFIFSKILKD
ncbi:MAG: class I SAM-dependent methyltransferase [Promethearchaeota archaeon]